MKTTTRTVYVVPNMVQVAGITDPTVGTEKVPIVGLLPVFDNHKLAMRYASTLDYPSMPYPVTLNMMTDDETPRQPE